MVEDDPEYQLTVKANTITVVIDNEILVVHKVSEKECFFGCLSNFVSSILCPPPHVTMN
jgi:hypothetical protein